MEIIESLKSKGFESSENAIFESENQSENYCQVVDKSYDNLENSKVIASGMFKINVSQSISPISVSKTSFDSNNVENKPKRKRRKRTSSKQNDKQVNNDVLRANRDFVHLLNLDTLSSVRRPKHKGVIWKKKWSSNTSNVDLSSVSNSNLNKDVKRYSRKDLLLCNNSHHVDTTSAYACNDSMNVSCNSRLYASYDVNDLFVFDDVSIINSQVSEMSFRKKPHDSLNVHSKNNLNNSLPRTLFRWFPKMQPLAEPVDKWIPKVKRQIDKISKTPNSEGPVDPKPRSIPYLVKSIFVRFKSGSLGFFRFSSPLRSKLCWRECSSYLGGLSGTLGIGSFLKNLLQDVRKFLML
ncbi:hypothetical protein Tco_1403343 [Tanacetum coccineum]